MRVKFNCDSGANIHSNNSDILDVERDLRMTVEEWKAMSEEKKFEICNYWAQEKLQIWYEEIED